MNSLISGGDGFKYTIDVSDANLGEYLPNVIDSLKTAFANIGQYNHSINPWLASLFHSPNGNESSNS